MSCEACAALARRRDFRVPADLTAAIRAAKAGLAAGVLQEVPAGPPDWVEPFSEIEPEGPWHDIVRAAFRCRACGQPFLLHADTYHGAGGWTCEAP